MNQYRPPFRHNDEDDELPENRFRVEAQTDPQIGKILADRYRIVSLVGRGGMGVVYKAIQTNVERMVAIKMLQPHRVADAATIKRFQQEAKAVSKVEHANSVRIFEFGVSDQGQPFLVMDFIDGTSLRQLLLDDGPLFLPRAQNIFAQVIEALSFAHGVQVVHKDMKPENIMLCERSGREDFVYVVDFGLSSTIASFDKYAPMDYSNNARRETPGSPPYMSPEQCLEHANVDHRSDIYSLAVVVYETLSGRLPYQARNVLEMLDAHIRAQPIPLMNANSGLGACEELSNVLLRAMEKDPDRRWQTIDEFGHHLDEAIKREIGRQNYLKNRKDSRDSGRYASDDAASSGNISQTASGRFVFLNCPHCGDPVEPGIAFCLGCGRSVSTSQDLAKVRSAQGVYSLPKSHDTSSNPITGFSKKTRQADSATMRLNRILFFAIVILVAALFGLFNGPELVKQSLVNLTHPKAAADSKHE